MIKIRKTRKSIADLYERERGLLSPNKFKNCVAASEDLVLRFGIQKKLKGHTDYVNSVNFNSNGDILISGAPDKTITLWDWDVGKIKLSFDSGHSYSILQAKFMPFSNDRSIVASSVNGEVRHAMIREGGSVGCMKLSQHSGRALKLAVEPESPFLFYSCGVDGTVMQFDLRIKAGTFFFVCRDGSTYVRLNDISIDPRNPNYFALGGWNRYVRLYDIRRCTSNADALCDQPCDFFCPPGLVNKYAMVKGLRFSNKSELLVSYENEGIHLFRKDQGLGTEPLQLQSNDDEDYPKVYKSHHRCYVVNFYGPDDDYVVGGSRCGRILIWRKKDGELLRVMEGDKSDVNCIEPHPYSATIASSGFEKYIKIWTPNSFELAAPVDMDAILKSSRGCSICSYEIGSNVCCTPGGDTDDEDISEGVDDKDDDIDDLDDGDIDDDDHSIDDEVDDVDVDNGIY